MFAEFGFKGSLVTQDLHGRNREAYKCLMWWDNLYPAGRNPNPYLHLVVPPPGALAFLRSFFRVVGFQVGGVRWSDKPQSCREMPTPAPPATPPPPPPSSSAASSSSGLGKGGKIGKIGKIGKGGKGGKERQAARQGQGLAKLSSSRSFNFTGKQPHSPFKECYIGSKL